MQRREWHHTSDLGFQAEVLDRQDTGCRLRSVKIYPLIFETELKAKGNCAYDY